jgi:hypothetical protein
MAGVKVRLETLGQFNLYMDGNPVKLPAGSVMPLTWQLFVLLAARETHSMSDEDLIARLWGDFASDGKSEWNSLKNLVRRLKKELLGFEKEPVLRESGCYRLSERFEFEADYLVFRSLCDELYDGREKAAGELFGLYDRILDIYKGPFTCPEGAQWMREIPAAVDAQFQDVVCEFCAVLWANEMYPRILKVYQQVSRACKPCDGLTVYRFRAMSMLGMYRGITALYKRVSRELSSRLDPQSPVFKEIREIDKTARRHLEQQEQAVASATRELSRELLESGEGEQATVCSYEELKRLCRENPGRYAMAVFTFQVPDTERDAAAVEEAVERFKEIAARSLRGHDVIAPYSENQLLVVLPNHSAQSGNRVKERLRTVFNEEMAGRPVHLGADVSELRPAR